MKRLYYYVIASIKMPSAGWAKHVKHMVLIHYSLEGQGRG